MLFFSTFASNQNCCPCNVVRKLGNVSCEPGFMCMTYDQVEWRLLVRLRFDRGLNLGIDL